MAIAPTHKQRPWQVVKQQHERTTDNSEFYNSRTWRKFRLEVLQEEPLCRECAKVNRIASANVLDHIIPIRLGGAKLSKENVQPLCKKCHDSKSGKEGNHKGYGVK